MKAPKKGSATNGGNGGYSRRKAMDMGLNKPLKMSTASQFATTGKTVKKK